MAQINKPTDYFNTKLYTGTGSTQSITGVGFQPDFTWIKDRGTTDWHRELDSVRGATKELYTNSTTAETTETQSLTSFDSDGFTLGTLAQVNNASANYVSWNWLGANGTASNTDGTITSSVSASTTSGFSIVSWTGTGASGTIGHGLGVAPDVMIIKNRDNTNGWIVYHSGLTAPATSLLLLNTTDAVYTGVSDWQSTAPTSSVFSVSNATGVNNTSEKYIGYCIAEKKGFSKFGSYTGNGSTDGAFVYTGFKPAFVIIKNSSTGGTHWRLTDSTRYPDNLTNTTELYPSSSAAETTNEPTFDFLSNGFKLRGDTVYKNGSGQTYIYMAFAENPLVGTNNIPATAR